MALGPCGGTALHQKWVDGCKPESPGLREDVCNGHGEQRPHESHNPTGADKGNAAFIILPRPVMHVASCPVCAALPEARRWLRGDIPVVCPMP